MGSSDDRACALDKATGVLGGGVGHVLGIAARHGPWCEVHEIGSVEDLCGVAEQIGKPLKGVGAQASPPDGRVWDPQGQNNDA